MCMFTGCTTIIPNKLKTEIKTDREFRASGYEFGAEWSLK